MRALVTGSGGFVGSHLCAHLESHGDRVVAWPGGVGSPDVREIAQLRAALDGVTVDVVYHLAAQSRVDLSWQDPAATLDVNTAGTVNLLQALAETGHRTRVVLMSSAEVYGHVAESSLPVHETMAAAPRTPYGVSKVAAEQLAVLTTADTSLDVVVCRPFNQIGPGQPPAFVTPSFARQVVANEQSGGGVIEVGNLDATRDFLDVRDAVSAYRLLATHGEPGEIYNIASGREVRVRSLLDELVARSTVAQTVVVDDRRFRPNDLPRMFGSIDKLHGATGWRPTRALGDTLADVLDEWRAR